MRGKNNVYYGRIVKGGTIMENLENVVVEEVIEEVAVEPAGSSVGSKLVKGALIAGAAFGTYKGIKWIVKKVKARKAKKAEEEAETVEEE